MCCQTKTGHGWIPKEGRREMAAAIIALAMVCALFFLGCVAVNHHPPGKDVWVPWPDEVQRIEELPRAVRCGGKAALLCLYYQEAGLTAWVVSGPWVERWNFSRQRTITLPDERHAWVEVQHPTTRQRHLVDPSKTNADEGFPAYYRERDRVYAPRRVQKKANQAKECLREIGLTSP